MIAHSDKDRAAGTWKGELLRAADGTVAIADGGVAPKVTHGWMWDLTVPGNDDHDFYVLASGDEPGSVAVSVLVHNYDCDLSADEGVNGGHTIERHVGKDQQYLIGRNIPNASSFTDLEAAQVETQANIDSHTSGIAWWLSNSSDAQIAIDNPIVDSSNANIWNQASSSYVPASRVTTVLVRDGDTPNGFTVRTSYADP